MRSGPYYYFWSRARPENGQTSPPSFRAPQRREDGPGRAHSPGPRVSYPYGGRGEVSRHNAPPFSPVGRPRRYLNGDYPLTSTLAMGRRRGGGSQTRRRLGKCIPTEPSNRHHKKPGRTPAEKTAPLNQSRLGRAPVGTTPIDQFTRHCGVRKIYWHHLLGSVEG